MDPTANWPVLDGNYVVVDPAAPVAVCTLTDQELPKQIAALPGVAIVGTLATANLGIERLVTNVVANPAIGHLLLCGRDSTIFAPGQSLLALARTGTDADRRIQGATGFDPVLRNLAAEHIDTFRTHVNVVNRIGTDDLATIGEQIARLADTPVPRRAVPSRFDTVTEEFVLLPPGGRRRQADGYDPAGYLVITVDQPAEQILVRHYRPDNTPAHQVRSRNGESILLALLGNDLVTQLDHAGYLGAELAKAETALRLGLRYVQDRPLRPLAGAAAATEIRMPDQPSGDEPADGQPGHDQPPAAVPSPTPQVGPAQSHQAFATTAPGEPVEITVEVIRESDTQLLDAIVADPDPADPYTRYRRTSQPVRVRYDSLTRVAMGTTDDLTAGALLRIRGTLHADGHVHAGAIAVITQVATLITT